MAAEIHFYYAIASRYSYLASTQITGLETETGRTVVWHPLSTGGLMAARGANPFSGSPISGQYEWAYRELDARRWATYYGVPYREPRGRVQYDPERVALAATAGVRLGVAQACSRALFSAMFVDDVTLLDDAELIRRAVSCGIDRVHFLNALDDPATTVQFERETRGAVEQGVFGVPSFVVGGEVFWGNDRIELLKHYIAHLPLELRGAGGR